MEFLQRKATKKTELKDGSLSVEGNFMCGGTKNRVVQTKNYRRN